jgi:GTP1/Obg family GTP-binding protein
MALPENLQEPARITPGLKSLQSDDEKRLFDIVDKLRELDVNHELRLPQLVVCGSQSSGKSSVLEAISEIPFPKGEMTCTKFVTV